MRGSRFLIVVLAAVMLAACMRQDPGYSVRDPQSGKTIAALPQRGFLGAGHQVLAWAEPSLQPPSVMQYRPERRTPVKVAEPPPRASHAYASASAAPSGAMPARADASAPYTLDAGDKLRVVVFGQQGVSNSYTVDAGGNVTLPLVGTIAARGRTTQALARTITEKLKRGYVREPNVSVEV
ncbi:MAG TPA: polysaccharide biosynthesis/export family protein, partial [Pseudolabrys sp.]|nr:polysaccharide biosynthesis/export family protein [Pseudolabrys sp.]